MISSIAIKAPTELITKRLDGAGYSSVGLDTAQRFVEDGPFHFSSKPLLLADK